MNSRYTDERNCQIAIYLLKAHGINKVVVSPGMTNVCLISSIQSDDFFHLISAPDERSAAYIACGIAQNSGESVVLSCTGATASRNYYPGLTEAYYSKLPLLVITSSRRSDRIGHNFDQVTDRTCLPKDIAKLSVVAPYVRDWEDEWACEIAINKAILELTHHGDGPVHINLETMYSPNRNVLELPPARMINRYILSNAMPKLISGEIAIVVGQHLAWTDECIQEVDEFCEKYDAAVFCDQISNYHGKYKIFPNIVALQNKKNYACRNVNLIISVGNVSSSDYRIETKDVWRVNPDGEIRDTFWKLTKVFEMEEIDFFRFYNSMKMEEAGGEFYKRCKSEEEDLLRRIPDLPFSNVWIAQQTSYRLPRNSIIHLGIRNSLRSWNYFRTDKSVMCYSNTGGFGIDGSLSTALGNSLSTDKLCYCVLGDLAFFYDMNALGNRHINNKIRILLINNGTGMEMQFSSCLASVVEADKDTYIAASGHYGSQSYDLVRHYAEDLGFIYLTANNKTEYIEGLKVFLSSERIEKPIIFETFVMKEDEDLAYQLMREVDSFDTEINSFLNETKVKIPRRNRNHNSMCHVIFGAGAYMRTHLKEVRDKADVVFACDNNPEKWGTEVAPGIVCISPEKLAQMEEVFVLIAIRDAAIAMQIASQLIDIGIESFDHIDNWLNYECVTI